ncbi:MAG TPA: hypothetical protein VFS40_05180 [Gemmatimonadales bacterium]|nr:hypothetical protein [Gemmatimonadales bacterium]
MIPGAAAGDPAVATAYGAVVLVHDEVRWHAATRTRAELFAALAAYVAEQAPFQLWPLEAARVRRWLHRGDREQAVRYYFATVGRRWDREQLHLVLPGGR